MYIAAMFDTHANSNRCFVAHVERAYAASCLGNLLHRQTLVDSRLDVDEKQ